MTDAPAEALDPFIQHARNYQRAAEGLAEFDRGFWNGGGLSGFHTAHGNEWAMRQALTSDPGALSAFILAQQAWLTEALARAEAAEARLAETLTAIDAAIQCETDLLDLYQRRTSLTTLDLAVADLKRDSLPKLKAARAALATQEAQP